MAKSVTKAVVPTVPYVDLINAMQSRLDTRPSDDEREYYRGSIAAARAQTWGTRHESGAVLDDFLAVTAPVFDSIVVGRVRGYGPLRLAYACEIAQQLAETLKGLDQNVVAAAGTSEAREVSLRDTQTLRRMAKRALRSLAGDRPEARRRAAEAARDEGNPDDRSRSLVALADELTHIRARVPARVADDAGATPELITDLRSASKAVLGAKEKARGERGKVSSIYDTLNELDGRVLHEIQLVAGAARDARRLDASIPAVRSRLVRKTSKRPAPVVPPVAPVHNP